MVFGLLRGQERKILIIAASMPGGTGVGEIYMSSLVAHLETNPAFVNLSGRDERVDSPGVSTAHQLSIKRRFEHAWRPIRTIAGEVLAWAGVRFRLLPYVKKQVEQIVLFARHVRATCIVAVLDGPTSILLAESVARRAGLPLYVLVWDMPQHVLGAMGHKGFSALPLLRAFDSALHASAGIAVMSEAMQQAFFRAYGKSSTILRQAIDRRWQPEAEFSIDDDRREFVIGFAGSVTAREETESLFTALDSIGWKFRNRRVRVHLYGLYFVLHAKAARRILYCGYADSVGEVVRGLAACDILFLPQPFSKEHEHFTQYSFPTKLTTYLAAGKPILLFAPAESALSGYFAANGIESVCTENRPAALLAAIEALMGSVPHRERVLLAQKTVAQRDFSEAQFRSQLAAWLPCHAATDG